MTIRGSAPQIARRASTAAFLLAALAPLPGCQSITGSPTTSQVRIVDASPDAGGLDVYQGAAGVLAYNLGLGTITSYVPITPGNYSILVDASGTRTQLVAQPGTFLNGAQYTVLIGNYVTGIQETILKDQSTPSPSGQLSIRLLDQSTRAGAVDVYLVPSGSTLLTTKPILTGVTFGGNSGYLSAAAGTYTLVVLPAGTVPTANIATFYTGAAVAYTGGAARTFVLIDQPSTSTTGVQVITAADYDPVGASS